MQRGLLGTQRTLAEALDILHVHQRAQGLVVDLLDLLDLVGGAEAVEEVQEGDGGLEGGEVGDGGQVQALLHGGAGQEREASGAGRHHILMVAEDGQGLGGEGARGDVEDGRPHLAGNLVHVRNHQHQALGGRVGAGQSTRHQRAVDGASRARLGLHLHHVQRTAEHVQLALRGPLVSVLAHHRGRGDRVDTRHFAECVGDITCCLVAVDGYPLLCHC